MVEGFCGNHPNNLTIGYKQTNRLSFLDASSHLYKRVCPSVRRSVGRWVGDAFAFRASMSDLGPCIRMSVALQRGNASLLISRDPEPL